MARRYHEIKGLAEFTAKTIVSSEEDWKKFLHTAGHMYKYPFREQMLIYAQRPDITIPSCRGTSVRRICRKRLIMMI